MTLQWTDHRPNPNPVAKTHEPRATTTGSQDDTVQRRRRTAEGVEGEKKGLCERGVEVWGGGAGKECESAKGTFIQTLYVVCGDPVCKNILYSCQQQADGCFSYWNMCHRGACVRKAGVSKFTKVEFDMKVCDDLLGYSKWILLIVTMTNGWLIGVG